MTEGDTSGDEGGFGDEIGLLAFGDVKPPLFSRALALGRCRWVESCGHDDTHGRRTIAGWMATPNAVAACAQSALIVILMHSTPKHRNKIFHPGGGTNRQVKGRTTRPFNRWIVPGNFWAAADCGPTVFNTNDEFSARALS